MEPERKKYTYNVASPDRYLLLKKFAYENKQHPTEAEMLLWEYIRSSQLGYKFNRQHIIGDYIVDFVCLDKSFVLEVDGGYHSEYLQIQYDEDRTASLRRIGFDVLRVTNEDVFMRLEETLQRIRLELTKR